MYTPLKILEKLRIAAKQLEGSVVESIELSSSEKMIIKTSNGQIVIPSSIDCENTTEIIITTEDGETRGNIV